MTLWRISRHIELSGRGGLLFAGRWHHAGTPAIYLAEPPAGALLETCVHTSANDIPPSFTLLKVVCPDIPFDQIDVDALQSDWPHRADITRELGSQWLKLRRSALLRVPSALVPETVNFLLNPMHADAALFRVEDSFVFPFDTRLKK